MLRINFIADTAPAFKAICVSAQTGASVEELSAEIIHQLRGDSFAQN